MISDRELLRFSRQIMLPQFDVAGQQRLKESRVLVLGLGGLGCPVALYLAAAGVGSLTLADGDSVDSSNLQRQIAHGESDLERNKAASAADSVRALNADADLVVMEQRLLGPALQGAVERVDLVVDASDSFTTRLELNQACIAAGRAWVSGAAIRSEGQVTVFDSVKKTPCYRCLYPEGSGEQALSCSETGVLAPIVGVIGSLQALEALKVIAGFGEPLYGSLLLVDGWNLETRKVSLRRDPDCPHCSGGRESAGA
jgi:adenylyltransferase/sulfurtransferase